MNKESCLKMLLKIVLSTSDDIFFYKIPPHKVRIGPDKLVLVFTLRAPYHRIDYLVINFSNCKIYFPITLDHWWLLDGVFISY